MKRLRLIYLFAVTAVLTLTACQNDSADESGVLPDGKTAQVRISVSPAQSAPIMRAWTDDSANDDEMMNIWVVVITKSDTDNTVEKVLACKPTGDNREITAITTLPTGAHHFYSFANMSVEKVAELLGITVTMPAMSNQDEVYESTAASGTVDADKVVTVKGNNFDPTAADNGFGAKGIPMSNVQTFTIDGSTSVNLVVVRMLAKVELQIYNDKGSGSDVTIESVTLTDVTNNVADNLKLLPNYTTASNADKMAPMHGDIKPNLNGTPATTDVTISTPITVSGTDNSYANSGTPKTITFYVNESVTPSQTPQNFAHFFLKIKLNGETEERYALIDDKGATMTDDNKWNYIARNDNRLIPVVLDDYKLDMIPYDFPAIGLYPDSGKEEDGIYTINFHNFGHFHLLPQVTKISNGDVIPFTATTPTTTPYAETSWGLIGNDFLQSWGSWTDATKATPYVNESASPAFYRTGYASWTPVDGDDVGGEPKWYPNTASPQWDPAGGTDYAPFILGYVADPGSTLSEDRKVYHEFSIYLYKEGMSAARQMTYRLYMILDKDQVLYSRPFGAPSVRHTHGY